MKKIILTLLLSISLVGTTYADYTDGYNAFQRGDYQTAFREWRPLANQGDATAQGNLGAMYDQGLGVSQDYKQAVRWYRKAADQGFAKAQHNLGLMYENGQGVAQDSNQAARWYRKAADQGFASAQLKLGMMYKLGIGVSQDDNQADRWLQKAADQGDADAQQFLDTISKIRTIVGNQTVLRMVRKTADQGDVRTQLILGYMYKLGIGVSHDDKQALRWFQKAADQGDADAQKFVDLMYQNGQGVAQNDKQALRLREIRKAADQGYAIGQYNLGWMYANGEGVSQDYKQAARWYRKAADQGYADAQYNLGWMYKRGDGVAQDDKQAARWYRKAADQGDADAQYNLGWMYANGEGVSQDYKQALRWYRKAADQGDADAQYNLGWMYGEGNGVAQDDKQAARWYRKAADQGYADAQYNLGWMYANGEGVSQDDKQALRWYRKAADQGDPYGQYNLGLAYEYGTLGLDKNYTIAIKYYKQSIQGDVLSIDSKNLAVQKIANLAAKVKPKKEKSSFAELWQQYGGEAYTATDDSADANDQTALVIDEQPPVIHITQGDNISITESQITLSGLAIDDSTIAEILVDGELVSINASGGFTTKLYVSLGEKKVLVSATDSKGNNATKIITITRKKAVYKNKDKELVPPLDSKAHNPNAVALIIGIDKYAEISNAQWAESDAGMFYDFANKSLGISTDRIRLIQGEEAAERDIWKSVEQWLPTYVDERKSDVYIYFAGHGLASENGDDVYLIPWDGDPELLKRTALRRSEFIDTLKDLKAASVTLFMDTCYSGKVKGGKGVLVADARGLRIVKKDKAADLPPNFTLFSAAASNETAWSHPSLKHGLFSYWMMRGLSGEADMNGDNKLTNGELHTFISKKVQKTAITLGHKQHPQLIGDEDKVIASW